MQLLKPFRKESNKEIWVRTSFLLQTQTKLQQPNYHTMQHENPTKKLFFNLFKARERKKKLQLNHNFFDYFLAFEMKT